VAPGDFAALKFYPALLCCMLAFFVPPYAALIAVVVAWFLPDVGLLAYVKHRQQLIRSSLPQAIDLLVLCIDAGLGLDSALQKISRDDGVLSSALNEELNILSREIFLGRDREISYQDLYVRTGVDELKTLGSALAQASKLGLSVATILRSQGELIRKRQGQKAEESALKMPIYMAFPLWFLIMPSLMLLVLGPSLIRFYQTLHAAGQ
jgi:tight adherence protein C